MSKIIKKGDIIDFYYYYENKTGEVKEIIDDKYVVLSKSILYPVSKHMIIEK